MPFELWRQDDNGNRFLIDTYDNRPDAEKRLADLAMVPHKQIYWIEERVRKSGERTLPEE